MSMNEVSKRLIEKREREREREAKQNESQNGRRFTGMKKKSLANFSSRFGRAR